MKVMGIFDKMMSIFSVDAVDKRVLHHRPPAVCIWRRSRRAGVAGSAERRAQLRAFVEVC